MQDREIWNLKNLDIFRNHKKSILFPDITIDILNNDDVETMVADKLTPR